MTRPTETAKPVVVPFDVNETQIHTGRVRRKEVEVRDTHDREDCGMSTSQVVAGSWLNRDENQVHRE
jgi:hypothetical protein